MQQRAKQAQLCAAPGLLLLSAHPAQLAQPNFSILPEARNRPSSCFSLKHRMQFYWIQMQALQNNRSLLEISAGTAEHSLPIEEHCRAITPTWTYAQALQSSRSLIKTSACTAEQSTRTTREDTENSHPPGFAAPGSAAPALSTAVPPALASVAAAVASLVVVAAAAAVTEVGGAAVLPAAAAAAAVV
eukprot:scaffold231200_cov22-Tisochrysis_lutea.AAC.1